MFWYMINSQLSQNFKLLGNGEFNHLTIILTYTKLGASLSPINKLVGQLYVKVYDEVFTTSFEVYGIQMQHVNETLW